MPANDEPATTPQAPGQGEAKDARPEATEVRGARYQWQMEQARRRAMRDIVEQRIEEARAAGKFDNLSGAGRPLPRDDSDVWAGERALAYHLLKSNDVAPQELERGREIDQELERAGEILTALRHARDRLATRRAVYASDRRAYNIQRDGAARRYEEALRAINSSILSLNIIAPAALHRHAIPVERWLEAFHTEFPRLQE